MVSEQVIQLDCKPGLPRPGDLIAGVMRGSGVEYDGRHTVSRCMGEWTWEFNDIPPETWQRARPWFEKRIAKLYKQGIIRCGSW